MTANPKRFKNLFSTIVICLLMMTPLFISCGSTGDGDTETNQQKDDGTDNSQTTTFKTKVAGKATLPWKSYSGQMWMIADGMDGSIYADGPTDNEGNFELELEVPTDSEGVLLYAINPANPADYVMAYAEVKQNTTLNISQAGNVQNLFPVNVESTAEAYVSMITNLPPAQFTSDHLKAVDKFTDDFMTDPPDLCSVDKTPTIIEPDDVRFITVDEHFDAYVNAEGTLIQRVSRAQDDVAESVVSANKWDGYDAEDYFGLSTILGVNRTRAQLAATLGPDFEFLGGLPKDSISRDHLELAADIIYEEGYGNCREKGLLGAYIASRFDEFSQVAFVGVESSEYTFDHGFAIACRDPESKWDIARLWEKHSESAEIPNGLFESGCMIIDPWGDMTRELTSESVKDLNWTRITSLTKVVTGNASNTSNEGQFSPALGPDLVTDLCTPFDFTCSAGSATDLKQAANGQNDYPVCTITNIEPVRKYYVFKHSGTGYRKMWGGWANKITGHGYYYEYIYPDEVRNIISRDSKFTEATAGACERGPALCPCAPYPDIWVNGNVEVVGVFETNAEMDSYRCDNNHYMGYTYICNNWETQSEQGETFWDPINGICGE